ncbi:hypothetical protein [Streptomyces sp. NPDC058466]|uniref:hypothetical protein n=1 Tax=Streptomyces sp. NPDC058466 TaxID=3346512 RepID=UPI0036654D28
MTQVERKARPAKALNGRMLMAAVVSAISGLLYGYDTGIISGALLRISHEFDIGNGMKQIVAAGILLGPCSGPSSAACCPSAPAGTARSC